MTGKFSKLKKSGRKPSYQKHHPPLEPGVVNDRQMKKESRTALESRVFTT